MQYWSTSARGDGGADVAVDADWGLGSRAAVVSGNRSADTLK